MCQQLSDRSRIVWVVFVSDRSRKSVREGRRLAYKDELSSGRDGELCGGIS